ncbi:MAG: YcxB family protein [Chloroflexota bacterium]
MLIEYQGQLTKSDLLQSLILHHRPSRPVGAIRLGLVALIVLSYLYYFILYSPRDLLEELGIVVALLMIVYLVAAPFIKPYEALPGFLRDRDLTSLISGKVTDQTITVKTASLTSELKWNLYHKHKRTPNLVLLYQAEDWYNLFPRSFFHSEDDWRAFLQLVEKNLPGPGAQ